MSETRWGDLPIIPETESGIAAIEREQITKPRPVEISGATLYQPTKIETITTPLSREESSIDPLTLHTIQLIQHSKNLRSLIQIRQAETESGANQTSTPLIPTYPDIPVKTKYDLDQTRDFVLGKGRIPATILSNSVRQLLTRSVAAICAHSGFDSSPETVLDTLSDIGHEHFSRICSLLRIAVDREAITGNAGFVDVMEQVFHEIGIGSIASLHNFYQTRIIKYHGDTLSTCQQLENEYEKIKIPQKKLHSELNKSSIKVKEEPVSDIQFPENEEPETVIPQTPPPLEELQGALQTMEKAGSTSLKDEESLKWMSSGGGGGGGQQQHQTIKKEEINNSSTNFDGEEEIINVSDSPEPQVASMTDVEISQSIPSVSVSDTMSPETSQSCKPPKKKKKKV